MELGDISKELLSVCSKNQEVYVQGTGNCMSKELGSICPRNRKVFARGNKKCKSKELRNISLWN